MISLIIPTIDHSDFLKLTVRSIRQNTRVPYEIIVWDNASEDDTQEWCTQENEKDDFVYIRSETNVGLNIAYNGMVKAAKYPYILIGNNDYYMLPRWDDAVLEVDAGAGWRGPMQIETSRPTRSITADYGLSVETFQEAKILSDFANGMYPHRHYCTFMPNILRVSDYYDLGAMDETKFFGGQEWVWRTHQYFSKKGQPQLTCPTSFFYHFRAITGLVKYGPDKALIDWRDILRGENKDYLASQTMTEAEQDKIMDHYGIHGPSLDANKALILYP
jgi:glycosyltransferase involved in cell wall biosynthesis